MHNNFLKLIKATIMDLIVALLFISIIILMLNLVFGQKIDLVFGLLNTVSITENSNKEVTTILDSESNKIINYPSYGSKYATIEISKINVNLPVYLGDTLEILKKGVGHDSGSYFPGEGGSIVYMGHNSKNVFRRFSELKNGDEIVITTDYGKFIYNIYDMQLINESEVDKLPIQKQEEKLMIYTCYPFNNIGYATQRYVVYANLTSQE